ncbi:PAAR domain-containing protein [Amycolatopsis sp. SID8362]|uniref:PAAR domain-containing protein n=1 Tax=Amycolatopsis sp. SID8362 TaxID=2690346 RepID=UPI00136F1407|nr:PAAR domain-containing protein [Amycolatopsis sp. SID8362]NBH06066.1 hypothetical protein [Amycolatopsis sp. SID8362]NED42765.1 hypothetical protein [Amycolatopsis sp. SID8362]
MTFPAAKLGDRVVAVDTHIILVPSPAGPTPVPTPLPFDGAISVDCSPDVLVNGRPAAVVGSVAINEPPHLPPDGTFSEPPTNEASIVTGSPTVFINGVPAARAGDVAETCNDPVPLPIGKVIAVGTVLFG